MPAPLTVKSKNIKPLIQFISKELDKHSSRQTLPDDTDDESLNWKPVWTNLKRKGFRTANSRTRLGAILGINTSTATASQKTFSGVINLLLKELPILKEMIDFKENPSDPDIWTLTSRKYDPVIKPVDSSTPSPSPSSASKPPATESDPESATISDDVEIDEDEQEGNQAWSTVPGTFKPNKDNVPSKMTKGPNPSTNKYNDLTQEDEFNSELIQLEERLQEESTHLIDDEDTYEDDDDNADTKTSDYDSKNNKNKNKNTEKNEITDIESSIIENAIESNTIGTLDVGILARWILSVSRKQEFDIAIHDGIQAIVKESNSEKVKLEQNNEKSYGINHEKLSKHTSTLMSQIDDKVSSSNSHLGIIQNKFSKIKNDLNNAVMTAKKELNKAEAASMMSINQCGNTHIQTLDDMNTTCKNTVNLMKAEKTVYLTSIQDVRRLNAHLNEKVAEQYDNFQDKIAIMVDDEKDNLREWLDIRSNFIREEVTLIDELRKEKDRIQAERLLMKQERNDLEKLMKEIIQKQEDIHQYNKHDDVIQQNEDEPIPHGTQVTYSTKVQDCIPATVLYDVPPYFDPNENCWIYRLLFTNIQQIRDGCKGKHITPITDGNNNNSTTLPSQEGTNYNVVSGPAAVPSPSAFQPLPHQHSYSPTKNRRHHYHHNTSSPSRHSNHLSPGSMPHHGFNSSDRQLGQHEFEYPIGTLPQSVNSTSLLKYGSKWTFQLRRASDLRRGFYERIKGNAISYGIYLRAYEDINLEEGVEAITPQNCHNYSNAYKAMNGALFQFLDANKDEIFKDYTEPLGYFEAFARKNDGFGFMKRVMKKRHPKLRDVHDRSMNTGHRPKYQDNLFEFIDDNIEWLHDEKLRGRSNYSDKENLNYIINALDDDRYESAKTKIDTILDGVNNKTNPKPFPDYLKLNDDSDLGLAILDMLKEEDKNSLMRDFINKDPGTGTINKMQTRSNSKNNKNRFNNREKNNKFNKQNEWAPELQWKRIDGAICPACGKSNHNVYSTGCPSLAIYCACKEFYDKTDKEKLIPVRRAFEKYQKELRSKLRARRNTDKMYLRRMAMEYDNEDMAKLKKTFATKFTEDFQQECRDIMDENHDFGPSMYDDLDDFEDHAANDFMNEDDDEDSRQ